MSKNITLSYETGSSIAQVIAQVPSGAGAKMYLELIEALAEVDKTEAAKASGKGKAKATITSDTASPAIQTP